MKIAIDVSPLTSGHFLQHRVRGTGFYLTNLKENLLLYFPENEYLFFKRGDKLPKDVDITHYPYFEPYFLTLPIGINKNSIVTVHDLTPLVFKSKFPAGLKGNTKWNIQKRLLKRAGGIITDSENSKKDIQKITNIAFSKIHVVYLSAADYFRPQNDSKKREIVKKLNLPEKFVLYVGDATWNKNLPRLIEAINQTNEYLVIAGGAFKNKNYDHSNPWNKDLAKAQEIAEKNNKIISLGFISNEDLAGLYSSATMFIMPSLYEGFGLPVLEAMQSGCPVITSREGSLMEVGGEAIYGIDPYDTNSIKDGIINLSLDIGLRKELSEKGLIQAKKFNWEKTARETFKVYESLFKK